MYNNLSSLSGEHLSYKETDITKILDSIAISYANKIAIKMDQQVITYKDLIKQAKTLAFQLQNLNISKEEPIGILLEPSIESIIAQLGILYSGGTCVPLDKIQPTLRLQNMLNNLDCNILITKEAEKDRLNLRKILTIEELNQKKYKSLDKNINLTFTHRTHILHTSGTTGTPKSVQIMAKGIMRLAFNTEFCPFKSSDIVSHISNPTFDASLFEIYGALLNGCTLQIISKQKILSPNLLQ